jgi:hypothetical protein
MLPSAFFIIINLLPQFPQGSVSIGPNTAPGKIEFSGSFSFGNLIVEKAEDNFLFSFGQNLQREDIDHIQALHLFWKYQPFQFFGIERTVSSPRDWLGRYPGLLEKGFSDSIFLIESNALSTIVKDHSASINLSLKIDNRKTLFIFFSRNHMLQYFFSP